MHWVGGRPFDSFVSFGMCILTAWLLRVGWSVVICYENNGTTTHDMPGRAEGYKGGFTHTYMASRRHGFGLKQASKQAMNEWAGWIG
jgi:hypothetical protein